EDLAQGVLKGTTGFDTLADVVYPILGNAFHVLALGHEGEKPNAVAFSGGAMASRFPQRRGGGASPAADSRGMELAHQAEFTLAQPGGLGAFRSLLSMTPWAREYIPVSVLALPGAHRAFTTNDLVNHSPSRAKGSIFGVWRMGLTLHRSQASPGKPSRPA
ncbi:MAG TPA: hypothetical protein VKV15_16980, partial [Bryobacteraceae bacterium]|nr:hypothetical protein [Bryobacteraceae bacterium]